MPGPARRSLDPATIENPDSAPRVGWGFITLYALSYTGGSLVFLAPLLVSLALKVNDVVGIDAAPGNLAMVTGIGSLLAIAATHSSAGSATAPPRASGCADPGW